MHAQNPDIADSLQHQLEGSDKTDRAGLLNALAWELKYSEPARAMEYAKEAAALSREFDQQENLAFAERNIGALNFLTGDFENARKHLGNAINIATAANAPYQLAKALNLVGLIEREKLNYKQSLNCFKQAKEIYTEIGDESEVTGVLHNLAFLYVEMNEKAEALRTYHEVLAVEEANQNQHGIGRTANNLGYLYINLENYETAREYFRLATEKSIITGNKNFESSAYHGMAIIEHTLKNHDKALELFGKAVALNKETNNYFWLGNNYTSISNLFFDIGKNNHGLAYNDSAIRIYDMIGLAEEKYAALNNRGSHYLEMNDLASAEKVYTEMIIIADSLKPIEATPALYGLYLINRGRKNSDAALEWLEKYMTASDSLQNLEEEKMLMEVETEYELKRMQDENEYLKTQNRLKQEVILNQNIVFVMALFIILSLAGLSFLLYRGRRRLKQAHAELQQKNEEIQEKSAQLQASNASKDKIFSIIAHDLRNPFNSLVGLSDLLLAELNKDDGQIIHEYAKIINQSARNGHSLLENLLQWSYSQRGTLKFQPSKLELHTLINRLLKIYRNSADEKDIDLVNRIPEHSFIYADPDMLAAILRNLFDNAIKFTDQNGTVSVSVSYGDEDVEICVSDTGVGIEKERIGNLFQPGHRSTRGTRDESGSGLGLILCREFVEQHKGNIRVESEPGRGSCFCFSLPLKLPLWMQEATMRESVS
ncbi:MAG: tetratricopeptide repeat protein [Bacteroidales bacterium]